MQKQLLREILSQNQLSCSFAFQKINNETVSLRLNPSAASVGFMYRHIGETMNLFGFFFGLPSTVTNTTMGEKDENKSYNLEESHRMVQKGFKMLEKLIEKSTDSSWNDEIDTPFFGKVSKIKLFSHVLFHNSHHAGQIALTIAKGA